VCFSPHHSHQSKLTLPSPKNGPTLPNVAPLPAAILVLPRKAPGTFFIFRIPRTLRQTRHLNLDLTSKS
jgi:hypothetical protein